MDVNEFAELVLAQTKDHLKRAYPTSPQWEWAAMEVIPGPKYTKVNVGQEHDGHVHEGKFMVENSTGNIYGIKAYGVVHKGKRYGTLDTADEWYWGDYAPGLRAQGE